jgi:hypothetical protein
MDHHAGDRPFHASEDVPTTTSVWLPSVFLQKGPRDVLSILRRIRDDGQRIFLARMA